ncbi:MAG: hypothetical protein NC417_13675 [Candidatus Gastranaerophilales bacterium]|nr:hypothetical protein [Candidatus Gastranaerophilales bacterium]
MEHQDIIAVVDKYKDYFKQWKAGVALGVKGAHVFYVLEGNKVELFSTFKTAKQLESLILGTLAENAVCILESATDNLSTQFAQLTVDDQEDDRNVEAYIPLLAKEISLIREEYKEWENMIKVTFKALENLGVDLDKAAKDYSAGK